MNTIAPKPAVIRLTAKQSEAMLTLAGEFFDGSDVSRELDIDEAINRKGIHPLTLRSLDHRGLIEWDWPAGLEEDPGGWITDEGVLWLREHGAVHTEPTP